LTTAIGRIASTPDNVVAQAMRAHPEMVGGRRRDVTALARAIPGLLAKDGFEAVQVAALPDGTAIGVKISDGSDRARMPVSAAALALAGVDPELLTPFAGTTGPDGLRVVDELKTAGSLAVIDR
jgi:L-asparaginase II